MLINFCNSIFDAVVFCTATMFPFGGGVVCQHYFLLNLVFKFFGPNFWLIFNFQSCWNIVLFSSCTFLIVHFTFEFCWCFAILHCLVTPQHFLEFNFDVILLLIVVNQHHLFSSYLSSFIHLQLWESFFVLVRRR